MAHKTQNSKATTENKQKKKIRKEQNASFFSPLLVLFFSHFATQFSPFLCVKVLDFRICFSVFSRTYTFVCLNECIVCMLYQSK